jgi:hypothetical protein
MSNILKLKNALNGATLSANQFRVIINPPAILGISLPEVDRVSILAKSVTTPESTIGTITVNQNGKPLQLSGDRTFDDISVDFRLDANMRAYDFLNTWSDFIVGQANYNAARSHSDYVGSMIIEKLRLFDNRTPDAEPEVTKRCFVNEVFIKTLSGLPLDQDSMNEGIVVSASFAYTNYSWS